MAAVLKITDGTVSVNLLSETTGFHLKDWLPAVATIKDGGVWRNSPLGDGRQLSMQRWSNVIESMTLSVNGFNQEAVIRDTQALRRLLEQARNYWTAPALLSPVWIEARADCETSSRYAYIYDYRTPNDRNPYGLEFAGSTPMFSDWILTIERGHWQGQQPGTLDCVPISSLQTSYRVGVNFILNGGFETAGSGGADVFANWTETAGNGTIVRDTSFALQGAASCRFTTGTPTAPSIRQTVNVTAGTQYILSWAGIRMNSYSVRIINVNTGTDITPSQVFDPVSWPANAENEFNYWRSRSIVFVPPAGCTQVTVVFQPQAGTSSSNLYIDAVSLKTWTPYEIGRAATCLPEVFFSNKDSLIDITHVFFNDISAGTFSQNFIGAALPQVLFPGVAAGDFLYVGSEFALPNGGPFTSVIFDLAVSGGTGNAGEWQYWNGSSWAVINPFPSPDIFHDFLTAGVFAYNFFPDFDWAMTTINGIFGYWIRYAVTTAGTLGSVQQRNRPIYTARNNKIQVSGQNVRGDISALARHEFVIRRSDGSIYVNQAILAVRSASRGANFSPIINFSNYQPSANVYVEESTNSRYVINTASGTGEVLRTPSNLLPTLPASFKIKVNILLPLALDYAGMFRVMMRVRQHSGNAGDYTFTAVVFNLETKTITDFPVPTRSPGGLEMIDLGKVVFPSRPLVAGTWNANILFEITVATTLGNSRPFMDMYELLLIPIDEYCAEFRNMGFYPGSGGIMDSTIPGEMLMTEGGALPITARPIELPIGRDQNIYLFMLSSEAFITYGDQLYQASRYLSMRGDQ